jgi:iron complex outermembrane recepter protein
MNCVLRWSATACIVVTSVKATAQVPAATSSPENDEVVQLEAYNVTTSLDRYAETNSSAGSKVPMEVKEMPYSLRVLNSAFLDDVRSSRLEDAFGYVTGLNKQGTNANAFTLRGFSAAGSNLQSVQVDGLPGPPSRFASPPTINVERLEVLKGPTSVLYGQANPGGLLNIVTKSPQQVRRTTFSTFLSTYAGNTSSFGDAFSYTASLDATGPLDAGKRFLYRLVLSYEDQESFRDYYYQDNVYIHPSLTYRISPDTFVTVKVDYVREERQSNDGLAVPFLNAALLPPINVSYTSPDALDTDYGDSVTGMFQTLLMDRWTVRATYRTTWHTDSRYSLETAQGAIVSNATNYLLSTIRPRFRVQENQKGYNFLDANIFGTLGSAKVKHTLLAGINGGKEWLRTNRIAFGPMTPAVNLYQSVPNVRATYPAVPTGAQDRQSNFWNYGVYFSDQISVGDKLDALLGWRWDKQDSYQKDATANRGIKPSESATLPTIGLVYHALPTVSLYGSYSEGFKPQAPGNVDINDNPNFPPESAEQIEYGVKLDALQRRLIASLAVYDIKKQNVLTGTGTTSPTGNPIANLSGLQQSKGVEFEVAYLPVPHWQIQAGYTYIDARVKKSTTATLVGALLDNTPHNAGNLWTRYNFPTGPLRGFGVGLGVIYVGQRQAIITNVATARFELPSYTRADFALFFRAKQYDLALNVQNALDRTYIAGALPGGADRINPGDPRKITLSARYNF